MCLSAAGVLCFFFRNQSVSGGKRRLSWQRSLCSCRTKQSKNWLDFLMCFTVNGSLMLCFCCVDVLLFDAADFLCVQWRLLRRWTDLQHDQPVSEGEFGFKLLDFRIDSGIINNHLSHVSVICFNTRTVKVSNSSYEVKEKYHKVNVL